MASILIFKNKYFQTHGLQNMWDLLSDVWNLRRMQLLLSTDRMANFLLFTDGKIPPPPEMTWERFLSIILYIYKQP